MKKSALYLVLFISTALLLAGNAKAVNAVAKLTLSPSSTSINNGDTFKVTVGVDSGSEVAGAVDGVVTFDSSKLELVDVVKASNMAFTDGAGGSGSCSVPVKDSDRFGFTCYGENSVEDKVIKGDLMVATFKGIATGTASVKFTCTDGSTSDTNIIKSATSTDVISCASNDKGTYTINQGSSSSSNDSSSDTSDTEDTTVTTTASELPKTGGIGSTIGLAVFGLVSVLGAVVLKFL